MMVSPALYDIIHTERGAVYSAQGYHVYERIYNNDFIGCAEQTIFYENGTTGEDNKTEAVRIFNNVFNCYRTEAPGVDIKVLSVENYDYATGVNDFFFVNNTVASSGNIGLRLYGHATNPYTNVKIENNIFYNNVTSIGASGGTFPDIANDTDAVLDYNLFYGASGYAFTWINAAHNGTTAYTALSAFETDHATLTNNIENDNPDFVSASDFQLQAGSPAIDTGADLSALTNMPTGWPFDKNGVTRTGSWDIGAYEYGTGTDTTAPTVTSFTIPLAGTTAVIGFSELITATSGAAFTMSASGGAVALTCPAVASAANTMTCTLDRTIEESETATYGYTGTKVADVATNALAEISNTPSVTNNSGVAQPESTLTMTKGTGVSFIESSPAGIICGSDCTEVFDTGTVVTITTNCLPNYQTPVYTGGCTTSSCTLSENRAVTVTCSKIAPDYTLGSGATVTLGSGAAATIQ